MARLEKDVKEYKFYQLLSELVNEKKDVPELSFHHEQRSNPFARRLLRHRTVKLKKTRHRTEIGYKREAKHYWSRRMYFVYSMLMGNGADGLPQTIRISFELSGFVFLLVRFITILVFVLPIMEVEVFLGKYSKLSNSQMYKMAPLAFVSGLSVMNFIFNILYVPILMTEVPLLLLGAIRFIIHNDYMSSCPTDSTSQEFCFDYRLNGSLIDDTCSSAHLSFNCSTNGRVAYVSQFYFWHDYYDVEKVMVPHHFDTRPLILVCCLSWFVLLTVVLCGMKYIELFFVLSAIFYAGVFLTIIIMVVFTNGATIGLWDFITLKKTPSYKDIALVVTMTTINLKLISPVGHMTYAAFIKEESMATDQKSEEQSHHTGLALIVEILHLLCGGLHILVVAMIIGVLSQLYGVANANDMFIPRIGMYYAMIVEFLHFKKVTVFFMIVYFMSLWTLELSKLAIVVHFQILNLFDFFPPVFRFDNYIRVAWAIMSFGLTLIMTYKYIFWFIPTYHMANAYFVEAIRLFALSFILFYVYGIKRIEDDVLFHTGKVIIKYLKIIGPIYPLLYLGLFISMVFVFLSAEGDKGLEQDLPFNQHYVIFATGMGISALYLLGSLGFQFLYIIQRIGSNTTLSNMLKPDFHWGPWNPTIRRERKEFEPRITTHSSSQRCRLQRFRQNSIRQMHDQDIAEGVQRGRIFLDSHFYTNCQERIDLPQTKSTRKRFS